MKQDSEIIKSFISHSQNTHKKVISNSVAIALINLNNIYFPEGKTKKAALETAFQYTIQDMRDHAKGSSTGSYRLFRILR